jgi:hypothetical protein
MFPNAWRRSCDKRSSSSHALVATRSVSDNTARADFSSCRAGPRRRPVAHAHVPLLLPLSHLWCSLRRTPHTASHRLSLASARGSRNPPAEEVLGRSGGGPRPRRWPTTRRRRCPGLMAQLLSVLLSQAMLQCSLVATQNGSRSLISSPILCQQGPCVSCNWHTLKKAVIGRTGYILLSWSDFANRTSKFYKIFHLLLTCNFSIDTSKF